MTLAGSMRLIVCALVVLGGMGLATRADEVNDYPTAAALSFILMAGILAAVAVYARLLGTEELTSGAI